MLGNTTVTVRRHTPGAKDSEGRPTAGVLDVVAEGRGHFFTQEQSAVLSTGRLVTLTTYRALLEPGSDVRVGDFISSDALQGEYRVTSAAPRIGPDGRVHHIAVSAEVGSNG